MKNKNYWFTLVELIVVITILAILWTIATISLWNFTMSARDSVRISDTKNIAKVLETYRLWTWVYPKPSNWTDITYSWGTIFTQWTFWKETRIKLWWKWNISTIPLDPLFENEYVYSLQSTNRSYNISFVMEEEYAQNLLQNKSYAAESRYVLPRVIWNFNWQIAHASTWWQVYVFAIPSLVVTDLSDANILSLTDKFVYDQEINIPEVYSWSLNQNWSFQFEPKLVYSWARLPSTPTQLKNMVDNVRGAINWTYLYSKDEYRDLVELNLEDPNEIHSWWEKFINDDLWWRVKLKYEKSCKEVQLSPDNEWSWEYTISPNTYDKIKVYCDMEIDWWGWTRVKRWQRSWWLVEWSDVRRTKWLLWEEAMVTYTRYWKIRKNIWWTRQDVDVENKKFWFMYKTFDVKQAQESWLCWTYNSVSQLVQHFTTWAWWDCSRSRDNPDTVVEHNDIQLDDLWVDIWLDWDQVVAWFSQDPCINNWHKTTDRNTSWTSNWRITHRIDSTTSLISIWWSSSRCDWSVWSESWLNWRWATRLDQRWITDASEYNSSYDTQDVRVR